MSPYLKASGAFLTFLLVAGVVLAFERTSSFQMGYPGTGMDLVATNKELEARVKANTVPPSLPPASAEGQRAVDAYKNVQVLGHLSSGDFTRLMTAITTWVAPDQGCSYCHAAVKDANGNPEKDEDGYIVVDTNNLHSDELYTKRVARRMLQMTMHINGDWQPHVKATGVTCYTCHRGNPVPQYLWFNAQTAAPKPMMADNGTQNRPGALVGQASLPGNPFETFLRGDATASNIRVISKSALPDPSNPGTIKSTEHTYGLMMHMSTALGVNCTYCHNTRSMAEWSTSPATRTTAWYGIRMVRDLNGEYLEPLLPQYPANRLGATGDAPKANCQTCHQGAFKPLLGVSMLQDYLVLAAAKPQPAKTVPTDSVPADAVLGEPTPGEPTPGDAPAPAPGADPMAAPPAPAPAPAP